MKVSSAETVNLSGAEVEKLDLDELEKKRLASIAPSLFNQVIKTIKKDYPALASAASASKKKKEKEEYITAKDFAQIKDEIDEENSTPLNNKVKLKSGELAFAAEGQEVKADETPAKGYVKETIVNGKFKYEVVPGTNDSPTKIYKIKVPRLEDGKHSTTDFDTMYFNAKGEVVSLDQGKGGESQLDPTWLAEKQEEYDRAMEEKALASAAIVSVEQQVDSMRSALVEVDDDDKFEDAVGDHLVTQIEGADNDNKFEDAVGDHSVTQKEREAVEAAVMKFIRTKVLKEIDKFNQDITVGFNEDVAEQLKIVLSSAEKINEEDMDRVRKAIEQAQGKQDILDDFHLLSIAVQNDHLNAVQCLLAQDADPNQLDSRENRPLDYHCSDDIDSLLRDYGAKTSIAIRVEVNEVVNAVKDQNVAKVTELLSKITRINALGSDEKTIMDHAIEVAGKEPKVEEFSFGAPSTWVRRTPKIDQILEILKNKGAKTAEQMAQASKGKSIKEMVVIGAPDALQKQRIMEIEL